MEKERVTAVVDRYEHVDDDIVKVKKPGAMGTVTISDTEDVIMVPTPSADPRGITPVAGDGWTWLTAFKIR